MVLHKEANEKKIQENFPVKGKLASMCWPCREPLHQTGWGKPCTHHVTDRY